MKNAQDLPSHTTCSDPGPDRAPSCSQRSGLTAEQRERRARQARQLERVADIGLELTEILLDCTKARAAAVAAAVEADRPVEPAPSQTIPAAVSPPLGGAGSSKAGQPTGIDREPVNIAATALAFDRLTRAVRQIMAMELWVSEGEPVPMPRQAAARPAAAPGAGRDGAAKPKSSGKPEPASKREMVENYVTFAITTTAEPGPQQEELLDAFYERFEDMADWARYTEMDDVNIADEMIRDLGFRHPQVDAYHNPMVAEKAATRKLNPKYAQRGVDAFAAGEVPDSPIRLAVVAAAVASGCHPP